MLKRYFVGLWSASSTAYRNIFPYRPSFLPCCFCYTFYLSVFQVLYARGNKLYVTCKLLKPSKLRPPAVPGRRAAAAIKIQSSKFIRSPSAIAAALYVRSRLRSQISRLSSISPPLQNTHSFCNWRTSVSPFALRVCHARNPVNSRHSREVSARGAEC